jgi:transposase InsO family protein
VDDYIEHFNNDRLHQTWDYLTPAEKLAELQTLAA